MRKVRQRPRPPLETFGPQWRELWLRASKEPIEIVFDSSQAMYAFRLRATQYRRRALEENLEGYAALYFAEAHMPYPGKKGPFILIFRPKEARHDEIFKQIGIEPLSQPKVLSNDPLERLIAETGGRLVSSSEDTQ